MPTGSTFFCLTVTVKEGRPVPEIEILPDDKCIEYELNKRYVYKYDGKFHLPERFTVYDCTHMSEDGSVDRFPIGSYLTYKFAYEMKIVEGSTDNSAFIDVGIYKFSLYVTSERLNKEDKYAPAQIRDVIVEIVE